MASRDGVKDDDIIVEVAKMTMQNEEIDDLGRALGIDVPGISAAQVENRHGVSSDGSRSFLRKWYRGQRPSEWKQKLINALREINREDILQKCFPNRDRADEPVRAAHPQSSNPDSGGRRDLEPFGKTVSGPSTGYTKASKWKNSKVTILKSCAAVQEMHYVMWDSLTKGNALIIGNDFKNNQTLDHRPWAEMDIQNMTLLLKRLGYDFHQDAFIKRNLAKQDMEKAVDKFVKYLTKNEPQSAVVYISSHGSKDAVLGNKGGHLEIPDLLQKFYGILPEKPKVIIIDACWGGEPTEFTQESRVNSESPMTSMPHNADIFLIHATSFGKYAWSFTKDGSWLVDKLCEVVYAQDQELEDLDTIMLRVTHKLRSLIGKDSKGRLSTQSPTVIKQGVDKKLFFYPGYQK